MIERPYYAQAQTGAMTEQFATPEEAIAAACEAQMAPFTVYQLIPQPVAQRLTNTDGSQLGRQIMEKPDGVEA